MRGLVLVIVFLLAVLLPVLAHAGETDIVINELMYNPASDDANVRVSVVTWAASSVILVKAGQVWDEISRSLTLMTALLPPAGMLT